MRKLAQEECGFEEPTVAMAFVYFEKLALKGKLDKQNRKLCAGACVLLAAKIGSDLKKHEVKHLIDVSTTQTWSQNKERGWWSHAFDERNEYIAKSQLYQGGPLL